MKVLIADKISEQTIRALQEMDCKVHFQPDLSSDDLPRAIADHNVLVVRSTKVTDATIDAASSLSLIVRAGAGYNTIDVAAASSRGIYVTNCPGKNKDAVAELAVGLLIAVDRRLVSASADLCAGKWRKKEYGKASGLKGRTLGVLGMGTIGRTVVSIAQSLGMNVIAWSRSLDDAKAELFGIERAENPWDLARKSDAISIHLASVPETKHLVNSEFLRAMRDNAILVNTSRGDLIDTVALKNAIREKKLKVGLDVFENEPGGGEAEYDDAELAAMVTATPHIGASTDQAAEAIAAETARIVRVFRETGKPPNAVNLCERTPATHSLVVRHLDRVGVLAGVLSCLKSEEINVEEMENTIFEGNEAACCTLLLTTAPSSKILAKLEEDANILQVTLEKREH